MEILIVICLLIVIVLLAWDKISERPQSNVRHSVAQKKLEEGDYDIMGTPKPLQRLNVPTDASEIIAYNAVEKYSPTESEITNEDYDVKIEADGLVDNFKYVPDFEEEEEEWRDMGEFYGDTGFATGVTFEELNTVGILLQSGLQEPVLMTEGVRIVQKIGGTELLDLIESSMEASSQKLSNLLGQSLLTINILENMDKQPSSANPFDINDFV